MELEELRRNIAAALRRRLETMGASQSELARRSGLTQGAISGWLNKRTVTSKPSLPNLYSAVNLAEALDVSLDFLLRGHEYWSELQDDRTKELLTALRGLRLDPRLPEMCRDFLSLDDKGRELALKMIKVYRESTLEHDASASEQDAEEGSAGSASGG